MDGQLAFFRVRPAKAMGRKGQSPALLFQPGTPTPHPAMGPEMALLAKFPLPGNVGMGNHLPGVCVLWCAHGRDTPGRNSCVCGLTVLVAMEGLSPWVSWFVTSQGWFGARFGPTLHPQSLLSRWGLPGWGQSLLGLLKRLTWAGTAFGAARCPPSSSGTAQLGSEVAMG